MDSLMTRAIRAIRLDSDLFEEVEADKQGALLQAMILVVASSIAATASLYGATSIFSIGLLTQTAFLHLAGWVIWALCIYVVGGKIFKSPGTETNLTELMRTIGFASAPGLLRIFGVLPLIGGMINGIALIWMAAAMVIAVRQALDYDSTLRAIGVVIAGLVPYLIISKLLL